MKKTTYILIGVLTLGAIFSFFLPVIVAKKTAPKDETRFEDYDDTSAWVYEDPLQPDETGAKVDPFTAIMIDPAIPEILDSLKIAVLPVNVVGYDAEAGDSYNVRNETGYMKYEVRNDTLFVGVDKEKAQATLSDEFAETYVDACLRAYLPPHKLKSIDCGGMAVDLYQVVCDTLNVANSPGSFNMSGCQIDKMIWK